MSQEKLAAEASVDPMTISRWERGESSPQPASKDAVIKAAQAVGESPLRLLQLAGLAPRDDVRVQRKPPPLREVILARGDYTAAQKRALLAALDVIEGKVR